MHGGEVQRTDAIIRVGPNQGGKKIRVQYRGFIDQNTKTPGVYRPKFSQYRGFIGQNTQTPRGSSKINHWIFSGNSYSRASPVKLHPLSIQKFNVRSSSTFDYLVLCLSSLRPAYTAQVFPKKNRYTPSIKKIPINPRCWTQNFVLPMVWTYPDGTRQRRRVAPRRRAPP